jgi:type I restriction enzyme S subunit
LEDVAEIRDFEREPINSSEREARIEGKQASDLFRYYGATGQVGWIDAFRSEGEQVLLGEDGAPFLDPNRDKAYIVSGRYWVNNHAHILRGISGLMENRLLAHQLNGADFQPHVSGSTRLKLTSAAMRRIPLLLPPIHEQARIVEKLEELLSDLDAGVAELKAAQRKLAQYRQSLLKAAVEGTLTADWRAARARSGEPQETGADLLQRILTERRARWEAKQLAKYAEQGKTPPKGWQAKYPNPVTPDTADLPQLPEGWVWASLDALIKDGPQNGLYLPANRYGRGTPILRIDDYQTCWHRERDALNRVQADASSIDTYALRSGDVVINRVNSMTHLGKCLEVTAALDGVLFESNMMRLRLHGSVSASLVSLYLGSVAGRARLTKDAKWAVNQASINQQDARRTPVPLPPAKEQVAVVDLLDGFLGSVEAKLEAIEVSLKQAAAQRKNILKAAFAGQLVPQDPNDEPASALLERIQAERTRLSAARGGKRTGSNPAPATRSPNQSRRGRKPRTTA